MTATVVLFDLGGVACRFLPARRLAALASACDLSERAIHERLWPVEAAGDALTAPFSAPRAGPLPWQLYRFSFHTAVGVATAEPYGATRWRFDR